MLKVLGEAAVAIEPSQCAFGHPAPGKDDEALGGIGPLYDLDSPFPDPAQSLPQLVTRITAIGKNMAQPREAFDDLGQHQRRAVAILDFGSVDPGMNQISLGIG